MNRQFYRPTLKKLLTNQKLKVMRKLISIMFIGMLVASFILSSCKKDDSPSLPTITYKQATGYVSANTTAAYNDSLNFSVTAKWNGTNKLIKFQIYSNGVELKDSTINTQEFVYNFYTYKTYSDKDVWKFVTTDIAGNTKSDSLTITGNFGDIYTYNSLTFGAQKNTTEKGFASFSNGTSTMYSQADAFNHQADIDLMCFYEDTLTHVNKMTLSSPGAHITGIYTGSTSPELYTNMSITYFSKTTFTASQFDGITKDAALIYGFGTGTGYRKANLLTVGDVWAFKLQSGKYGLFKVTAVQGTQAGTLQIAVKIQK